MTGKPPLIAVVGTNASGKSALGIRLAEKYNGEIISADSRQVFKRLDLGSGKVTPEERKRVVHHLLDVAEPGDFFSMADFQRMAYPAIDSVLAKGKLPFLVGGTGLYVDSVTEGYVLSDVKPDLEYREYLETLTTPELYARLTAACPEAVVDPNNRNRVMRQLEKLHAGDSLTPGKAPRYDVLFLGVSWDRETLLKRIDERLEKRVRAGMIEEVQSLLGEGVSREFLYKLGLEYRYIAQYLTGELPDRDEMLSQLSLAIKRFAKRQMTWFKKNPNIHWLCMTGDFYAEACRATEEFLEKH